MATTSHPAGTSSSSTITSPPNQLPGKQRRHGRRRVGAVAVATVCGLATVGLLPSAAQAGTAAGGTSAGTFQVTINDVQYSGEDCMDVPVRIDTNLPRRGSGRYETLWRLEGAVRRAEAGTDATSLYTNNEGTGTFTDYVTICDYDGAGTYTFYGDVETWYWNTSAIEERMSVSVTFQVLPNPSTTVLSRVAPRRNGFSLAGRVTTTTPKFGLTGVYDSTVQVQLRARGSSVWRNAGTLTTAASGAFSGVYPTTPPRGTRVRVVFPGTSTVVASTSGTARVA